MSKSTLTLAHIENSEQWGYDDGITVHTTDGPRYYRIMRAPTDGTTLTIGPGVCPWWETLLQVLVALLD